MDIKAAIKLVTGGGHLTAEQMTIVMRSIMTGETSDAQNAAFLVGLQMKGVQAAEILGGATVMRELSTKVVVAASPHLVDTCGTGGSGSDTFNVSTAAALVAACAGAIVAKHGNRGATSKSGSADVLEAAGVNLALSAEQVAQVIEQVGVGFMFAPAHHSAMKHVITARKEIGVRTVFNLLGPLTNPASAPNQIIGVYDQQWIEPMLDVLAKLGSQHVLIVAADDGLDEISIAATTRVGELNNGKISSYTIAPEDLGIRRHTDFNSLKINNAQESLSMVKLALTNQHEAAADIVAVNAGAAIYAANLSESLLTGVQQAKVIIESGVAGKKLTELVNVSQSLAH